MTTMPVVGVEVEVATLYFVEQSVVAVAAWKNLGVRNDSGPVVVVALHPLLLELHAVHHLDCLQMRLVLLEYLSKGKLRHDAALLSLDSRWVGPYKVAVDVEYHQWASQKPEQFENQALDHPTQYRNYLVSPSCLIRDDGRSKTLKCMNHTLKGGALLAKRTCAEPPPNTKSLTTGECQPDTLECLPTLLTQLKQPFSTPQKRSKQTETREIWARNLLEYT